MTSTPTPVVAVPVAVIYQDELVSIVAVVKYSTSPTDAFP